MRLAQLDLGGVRPWVATPSSAVGWKLWSSPQAALKALTVARSLSGGSPSCPARASMVSALIGGNTDGMNNSSDLASMIA